MNYFCTGNHIQIWKTNANEPDSKICFPLWNNFHFKTYLLKQLCVTCWPEEKAGFSKLVKGERGQRNQL